MVRIVSGDNDSSLKVYWVSLSTGNSNSSKKFASANDRNLQKH